MSDQPTNLNEADVLLELEALAPQVKAGFERIGGPSDRVLDAIHAEAVKVAAEKSRGSRLHVVFRALAAAAVFAVLLTGSFQTYQQHQNNVVHEQALTLLRISSATEDDSGDVSLSDTAELANILLSMQGLDHDSYFSALDEEEAGFLWL